MMCPSGIAYVFSVNFHSRLELCVVIKTNVAQLLFEIPSNLPLFGGSERVPSPSEVLQVMLCGVTASRAKDGVMQSVTFMDGHSARHAVTRVHRDACRESRNVQDSLARHVHGGHVERLKRGPRGSEELP